MKSCLRVPLIVLGTALAQLSLAVVMPSNANAARADQKPESVQAEPPRLSRAPAQVRSFRTAKEATISMRSFRIPEGRFPETELRTSGLAAASADRMNGRIWVMAMRDGLSPEDYADAGFKGPAFSFSGADTIRGATATATIIVRRLQLEGDVTPYAVFAIGIYKDGSLAGSGRVFLTSSGTYTVTTTPVDLSPGARYHVVAGLTMLTRTGSGSRGMVSDAEITEIRWSF